MSPFAQPIFFLADVQCDFFVGNCHTFHMPPPQLQSIYIKSDKKNVALIMYKTDDKTQITQLDVSTWKMLLLCVKIDDHLFTKNLLQQKLCVLFDERQRRFCLFVCLLPQTVYNKWNVIHKTKQQKRFFSKCQLFDRNLERSILLNLLKKMRQK